ncbi:hypothetical protein CAter282_4365 [Collimonas arenae]|uniref:Uncharacterized protein n=2 Tax=Collimonas arenae TaxID=279058 RepID=A0A127PWL2_9BURK|nr:hypothetical protein CAter10_4743 [Collimonas arenae]AMP12025.1 hypothetical protein CAter282_4365 [Collimonas arenae]
MQRDEKDLAVVLREASMENIRDLEELMSGQGFVLVTLNSFDVAGIGQGSRVYILARKSDNLCSLLSTSQLVEKMDAANGRATAAKIWFTQIWLAHLDLLYTQRDRGPHERNQWIDATFTKEMLEQAVREHINGFVRRLNPNELMQSDVYEVLTAEKGTDIARYTKRFLDLMCECGMLDERGDGVYRQSLLSAVEMKENYDRTLAPLMIDADMLTERVRLATLSDALLTKTAEEESNGGTQWA